MLRRLLVTGALFALLAGTIPAAARTSCSMGGGTPSWQVLKIEIPEWNSNLTLRWGGRRALQPVNDENTWHRAMGIMFVNARTGEVPSFYLENNEVNRPWAAVVVSGMTILSQPVVGPEGLYTTYWGRVDNLTAGTWYVVGFGVGGGSGVLGDNEWRGGFTVEGAQSCEPIDVAGETFDYHQTDFSGGTHVYAAAAGYADNIELSFDNPRRFALGFMQSGALTFVPGNKSNELRYSMPSKSGSISGDMIPLISGQGRYSFQADYHGVQPGIIIAGVTVDLPSA